MTDTLPNITVTAEEWVNVYSLASIDAGTPVGIQNTGVSDLYYSVAGTQPARDSKKYKIFRRAETVTFDDNGVDAFLWVFSPQINGLMNVFLLRDWSTVFAVAFNDTFGIEMAQDFAFGGTPVGIHDGIDLVLWTGTEVVGNKVTFSSADRANTGSFSVKIDNASVSDITQFDKGSDIDLSNYIAITLFINVDKDWAGGDSISIYGWDTGLGQVVGNLVFLEDYFSEGVFSMWHKLSIPLPDMGLSNSIIDAFRIEIVSKEGKSPKFYIDDFQVEETGATAVFSISAENGALFEVNQISFAIAGPLDTTLVNASMPNLSYDAFLNLPELDNGLLFQSIINGEVIFGGATKTIGDLIRGGAALKNVISDGTNTHITLELHFGTPLVVDSRTDDKLQFILSDDLSGLISLSVLYTGRSRIV